jgi:hypothetical protein
MKNVLDFLTGIGMTVAVGKREDAFLPGVSIAGGILTYDPEVATVGDVLHEAGHLAVIPSIFRDHLSPNADSVSDLYKKWFEDHPEAFEYPENPVGRAILQSGETEAIAWSYAAAVVTGVSPEELFLNGFGSDGVEDLTIGLSTGRYLGVNGLHHSGMTTLKEFPKMIRWMQE